MKAKLRAFFLRLHEGGRRMLSSPLKSALGPLLGNFAAVRPRDVPVDAAEMGSLLGYSDCGERGMPVSVSMRMRPGSPLILQLVVHVLLPYAWLLLIDNDVALALLARGCVPSMSAEVVAGVTHARVANRFLVQ